MLEVRKIGSLNFKTASQTMRKRVVVSERVRECRRRGLLYAAQTLAKAAAGASDTQLCANGLFQNAWEEIIDYRIANRGIDSNEVRFADEAERWLKEARASA